MAAIDYGALVFKNNKLINTSNYMDMKTAVGWEDFHTKDEILPPLRNNYFAYIGDKKYTLAFYKTNMAISTPCGKEKIYFANRFTWKKWQTYIAGNKCRVIPYHGYYKFTWQYKKDKYVVYFGYGVDFYSYQNFHLINAYSPLCRMLYKLKFDKLTKIFNKKEQR